MTLTAAGAERRRVDGFGRLDLGVRQASDWYLWEPYVSERQSPAVANLYGVNPSRARQRTSAGTSPSESRRRWSAQPNGSAPR
jgi:hypothetical protein